MIRPARLSDVLALRMLIQTQPLRRLRPALAGLSSREKWIALAWAPTIRVVGDVAKMLGYPVGVWWRWHYVPRMPWPKRQR